MDRGGHVSDDAVCGDCVLYNQRLAGTILDAAIYAARGCDRSDTPGRLDEHRRHSLTGAAHGYRNGQGSRCSR